MNLRREHKVAGLPKPPPKSESIVMFAWLISCTFSADEQYFSLTTNQLKVLSAMAYQPNEQDKCCTRNCFTLDEMQNTAFLQFLHACNDMPE